jgi:hypothetical protein
MKRSCYLIIDPFAPTSKRYLLLRVKDSISDGGYPVSEYICYNSELDQIVKILYSDNGRVHMEIEKISLSLDLELREYYKDEISGEEPDMYTSKW